MPPKRDEPNRPLDYAPPGLDHVVPWRCSIAVLGTVGFLLLSILGLAPGLHNEHYFLKFALLVGLISTLAIVPALPFFRHVGPGRRTARAAVTLWLIAASLTGLSVYDAVFGEDPHVTTRRWNYCASRLRSIGQAMMLYANDHSGKYPDSLADLLRATPDIEAGAFTCPAVVPYWSTPPSRQATIAELAGGKNQQHIYLAKGMTDKVGLDTVLAHDNPANWAEHGGGMSVWFGDLSVVHLERREAQKLLAELAAGHNPPRRDQFRRP